MARPIRTVVIIDADGKPATVEISNLQKATRKLDKDVDKVGKGLGDMKDKVGDIPGPVGDIASALTGPAGVVGGIGAAVGGLIAMANSFATTAIEAESLAVATDSSVEEASQLLAAVKEFGLEFGDVTDIALQVTGALEGNVELMAKLGLNAEQAESPMVAIKAAIDSWDLLSATERAAAFGEEGVRQIAAIIASGKDLDQLLGEVSSVEILSDEDVERARQLQETTAELKQLWDGIVITVGGFVAKDMQDLVTVVKAIGGAFGGAFSGNEIEDAIKDFQRAEQAARAAAEGQRWEAMAEAMTGAGAAGVEAFSGVNRELDILKAKIDDRQTYRALEDQFAKLRDASAEWTTAAVEGTDDIDAKQRAYNIQLDLTKEKIIDYASEVLGLPDEAITDIVARTEPGNIAFVEAQLAGLARRRVVALEARSVGQFLQTGPGGTGLGSSPVNNLTVNLGAASSIRDVDAAIARWRQVNG